MCAFFFWRVRHHRECTDCRQRETFLPMSAFLPSVTDSARRVFVLTAVVLLAFKSVLAASLPLTGDEAYFVLWARNPDWGFYDHPPMVGWWLSALGWISWHPFMLRLPALLVPLAIGLMTAAALGRLGGSVAWSCATLALLLPLNAWNVAVTTDVPLMFFGAAAVVAYLRAMRTDRAPDWLLTGAMLSGALMSKYFAGLLAIGMFLHLVSRPSRASLRALALIVVACLPAAALHLAWNWQNCWPNLMFNLVNRHGSAGWSWKTPLLYVVTVVYVLTPFVVWQLLRAGGARSGAAAQASADRPETGAGEARERAALAWMTGVPLALLGLLSAVKTVGLHWLAAFGAPAVLLFAFTAPLPVRARALRFGAAFAALHWVVIGALSLTPIEWFAGTRIHDGIVMTLRPELLNARIAPYLDRFEIAARGYSPAATIGFNLGQPVLVFGPGSGHARQDDLLTDFRALDGRDLLVISKETPEPADYEPYFGRVEFRHERILGATFHFVLGYGFRYDVYRDAVLEEIRTRWYAVPPWLPSGPCYFCDRYFPERACHR
ncbi:MAG: hypothetical protein RIS35_3613 [Pseudomonadota bacterium]|jgi:hypothetical protein